MCKRDTESAKVEAESVLSNRGNLKVYKLDQVFAGGLSPGGGVSPNTDLVVYHCQCVGGAGCSPCTAGVSESLIRMTMRQLYLTCYRKSHSDVGSLPPPNHVQRNIFHRNVNLFRLHTQLAGNKCQTVIINFNATVNFH